MDGLTGRAVRAAWNLGTGRVTVGPFPPGTVIDEAAEARVRAGVEESLALWESRFVEAGETRPDAWPLESWLPHDDAAVRPFVVRPPPGYVREDASLPIKARLAAGVRQTVYVLPLWPEAILEVQVLDPEGRPAEGVELDALAVAGRRCDDLVVESEGLPPGRLRIRGIPRLPGEPVWGAFTWGVEEAEEAKESEDLAEIPDPQLKSRIPAEGQEPWRVEVHLPGPCRPGWYDVEFDNDLPFEESLGGDGSRDAASRSASIRACARGWNGAPMAGVRVYVDEVASDTDTEGRTTFGALAPGEYTITWHAPGHLPVRRTLTLAEGESADVTLQEPIGATLEVFVTDEDGRPRPSASLDLGQHAVFDVLDGVQRLDPFTDATGRRTLHRVEPGSAVVSARWGSRSGRRTVDLVDGETTSIRIVAK